MEQPKRKHEVGIRIGADSWEDVIHQLEHILFIAETSGPGRNSYSGSPSSNHSFVDTVEPHQTHEGYFKQLNAWLAEHKAKQEAEVSQET